MRWITNDMTKQVPPVRNPAAPRPSQEFFGILDIEECSPSLDAAYKRSLLFFGYSRVAVRCLICDCSAATCGRGRRFGA